MRVIITKKAMKIIKICNKPSKAILEAHPTWPEIISTRDINKLCTAYLGETGTILCQAPRWNQLRVELEVAGIELFMPRFTCFAWFDLEVVETVSQANIWSSKFPLDMLFTKAAYGHAYLYGIHSLVGGNIYGFDAKNGLLYESRSNEEVNIIKDLAADHNNARLEEILLDTLR